MKFTKNEYATTSLTPETPLQLTVASFNLRSGNTNGENIIAARNQMQQYEAQIVGIQEMDSNDSYRLNDGPYIPKLNSNGYNHCFFAPAIPLPKVGEYGTLTLSVFPLIEKDKLFLPHPAKPLFNGEERVLTRCIVQVGGIDIAFYNTHLAYENSAFLKATEVRKLQFEYIRSIMEADPCKYQILTGDFNVESFSEFEPLLENGDRKAINTPQTAMTSYRGNDASFKSIDNIFYSDNFELTNYGVVDSTLSDHNMLFATLKIK